MAQYLQRVASDADDGAFAGSWFTSSSSWHWGRAFTGAETYGAARFLNVNIPQGTVITSAFLRVWDSQNQASREVNIYLHAIDEDNAGAITSDPDGRAKTSARVGWNQTIAQSTNTQRTSPDIKSIIQEIVDRGGWSSGNSIVLISDDNGTGNDKILRWHSYSGDVNRCAQLEINWGGPSPSASVSPSSSQSPSVSASVSPSASISPSSSPSPSPAPPPNPAALKIAKPGVNVLTNSDIEKLIFSSEYGTLKYFDKVEINTSLDAGDGDITSRGEYAHNLGYYPFVEVYVSVYIGSPTGIYEYCPFVGSGASVAYGANVKVTTDKVTVYGEINGVSSSVWHFDFIVFIYKNNLFPS